MRALNQNSQNMLDLDIIKQETNGLFWLPERLVKLDPVAVEILKLVDGKVSVGAISTDLSKKFNAPKEVIMKDVIEMLQELSDKGFIEE